LALAFKEARRVAMAVITLFRIGADATGTGGVSGKVSRGARGMGAVGAAGTESRTWPPLRWPFTGVR
jgi:hypothetical protein